MSNNNRVQMLGMRVKNVKCIRLVEIDNMGQIHEVRGNTRQGKTAILDSFELAFRGLKGYFGKDIVRHGADQAEIMLELTDTMIQRIIGADGKETVMVKDGQGREIEKAREYLLSICGPTIFRPVDFAQLGGGQPDGRTDRLRTQRNELLRALRVSLTAEDVAEAVRRLGAEHSALLGRLDVGAVDFNQPPFTVCELFKKLCYDARHEQNIMVKQATNRLENTPAPERPAPEISLEECEVIERAQTDKYHEARARTNARGELEKRRSELRQAVAEAGDVPDRELAERTVEKWSAIQTETRAKVAELEAALQEARKDAANAEAQTARAGQILQHVKNHAARVADLEKLEAELGNDLADMDLAELSKAATEARQNTEARRLQDAHDETARVAAEAAGKSQKLTELVELFRDTLPKALLASADLGIDGLEVDDEKILIQGMPLHQLGTEEQIEVAVLLALALNPRMGFVPIDRAESLGPDGVKRLADIARRTGAQFILTFVDPEAVPGAGVTVMKEGRSVKPEAAEDDGKGEVRQG